MRIWVSISVIWALGLVIASPGMASVYALSTAILLEILRGEASIIVGSQKADALWDTSGGQHETPVQNTNYTTITITSEKIIKPVTLGNSQVTLKQQFRNHLAHTPNSDRATGEVFNSLRDGWFPVLVRFDAKCALDETCQSRLEAFTC